MVESKRDALRVLIIEAARELDLIRDTPDDRLMVMGLKKVRAAIRHLDEFEASAEGRDVNND